MDMPERDQVIEKLRQLAPQGKISCSDARKLAEELEISNGELGELCDELKIKIFACELGCF